MRVTVCELADKPDDFIKDWEELKKYLQEHPSDLVLLPELPFYPWIAWDFERMHQQKMLAVEAHETWEMRIGELGVDRVVYTKPTLSAKGYHNTAFLWQGKSSKDENQLHKLHSKHYFPEEDFFWEASLYSSDQEGFSAFKTDGITIGIQMCSELWFMEHARDYGKQGIDLLLCPRSTGKSSISQWIRGGQTAAVVSGAYCLSSNRSGQGPLDFHWGGGGWVAQPLDGKLLGTTGSSNKFLTVEIDLSLSKKAKTDYPLNVQSN